MFDSHESAIARGLLVWPNNLWISYLQWVSDSRLRVGVILFEYLGRLSAFKSKIFWATVESGTHDRYPCPRKCLVLLWVSHVSLSLGHTDKATRSTLVLVLSAVIEFAYGVSVE